jgi:preprotein translocase subunit SecG
MTILAIIYAVACLLLVIMVLLQSGKGAGMGIFGGGSNTTFGTQGGDILTRITTVLGVLFFGIALLIAFMVSRDTTVSGKIAAAAAEGSGPKIEAIVAPGDNVRGETNAGTTNTQAGPAAQPATDLPVAP